MDGDVYWLLVYRDEDRFESFDHESIRGQRAGATQLNIVDAGRMTLDRVALTGGKPIFYRRYRRREGEPAMCEYAVYGCVHDDGTRTLKAYTPEIVDAGEEHIDETMIAHLTS